MAAGPIGRNAEASGTASVKSVAAVYSYSKTRGLFAGVSLEGSVILERFDANAKMYGRKVSVRELLNGTIPPPPQADPLYLALDARFRSNSFNSYARDGRFSFMQGNGNSFGDRSNGVRGRPLGRAGTMYNSQPVYGATPENDQCRFSRANVRENLTGGGGEYSTPFGRSYGDSYGAQGFDGSTSPGYTGYNLPREPARTDTTEKRARALFNFAGEQDGDLPFRKGDIITIVKRTETQQDW